MRIDVERRCNAGMPQLLLNQLRLYTVFQQNSRTGMSISMEIHTLVREPMTIEKMIVRRSEARVCTHLPVLAVAEDEAISGNLEFQCMLGVVLPYNQFLCQPPRNDDLPVSRFGLSSVFLSSWSL